jgi:hypothetical protein
MLCLEALDFPFRTQHLDLTLEVVRRPERPVDAREAQVRHLVELAQRREDRQPHLVAGDLGQPLAPQRLLDLLAEAGELVLGDRAALARLRTPCTALSRLNGSAAPERLATISCICSTVVNRFPHSWQTRRRRIWPPSSATRESSTLVSLCRQNGQCTVEPLS